MQTSKIGNFTRTFFKVIAYLFLGVIGLLFLIVLAVQLPPVQNRIAGAVSSYLAETIGTIVYIEKIGLVFPKTLSLNEVYVEDQTGDTLLYAGRFHVNVNLPALLGGNVYINDIFLEDAAVRLGRNADQEKFNYEFILEAFSSPEEDAAQQKEKGQEMDLAIYSVKLKNVDVRYKDEPEEVATNLNIGNLEISLDEFNLNDNLFRIDFLDMERVNLWAEIASGEQKEETDRTDSPMPVITINEVNLSEIKVQFSDASTALQTELLLGYFGLRDVYLNVAGERFEAERIDLSNTKLALATLATEDDNGADLPEEIEEDAPNWRAMVKAVNFNNIEFNYSVKNKEPQAAGIDFNHLSVTDFNFAAEELFYSSEYIQSDIRNLSFREKSGFEIKELSTVLTIDESRAALENFLLKTKNSRIAKHFEIQYPSLEEIGKNPEKLFFNIDLEGSIISPADVLLLSPELSDNPFIKQNSDKQIALQGVVSGQMQDLAINNFSAVFSESMQMQISGKIRGLPEAEKAEYHMKTIKFSGMAKDLNSYLPPDMLPENIAVPEKFLLEAEFFGTLKAFQTYADFSSTFGDVVLNARVQQNEEFSGEIVAKDINIGGIIKQPEMFGTTGFSIKADGAGIAPETMKANISALVDHAEINNYQYRGLSLQGLLMNEQFNGTVKIEDENLDFELAGIFDFREELPDVNAVFQLRGADLRALNFSQEDFRLQGTLEAEIKGNTIDNFNGDMGVRDVIIIKNNQTYKIDSLLFASVREDINTNYSIESDFLSAHFRGTINPSDIADVLQAHLNEYLHSEDAAVPDRDTLKTQNFDFHITVKDPVVLTDLLVPGLKELRPVNISGSYDSENSRLEVLADVPLIVYNDIRIEALSADVQSNFKFRLNIKEVAGPSYTIPNIAVAGNIFENRVNTALNITEDEGRILLSMPIVFRQKTDSAIVTVPGGSIILNNRTWSVPLDNNIVFTGNGFRINNFGIQQEQEFISVNTKGTAITDLVEITFGNFNIGNISSLIEDEELLYRGHINGNIILRNLQTTPVFTSDLAVSNFSFKGDTIGNILLQADNIQGDVFSISASVKGFGNNVNVNGTYQPNTESFNFAADLNSFELASVSGFAEESFHELYGTIRGNLRISGTIDDPNIVGQLRLIDAGVNPVALNSFFAIENERVLFDSKGIRFPEFTVRDEDDNKAVITGYILTENYREMDFDLNVRTRNFLALNRTEEEADLYYGRILLNSDIRIGGNLELPVVEARINLLNGTRLTYIIPETQVAMVEQEGIVEFEIFDKDEMSDIMLAQKARDTLRAEIRGIDLRANVTIDEATVLRIIIDESSGDFLEIRGGAIVSFGIDRSGAMNLTGTYEIDEGKYQLSFYDLVRREFDIRPGSTITWSGDPLNADVDISAIYTVRTSPSELMAGRVADDANRGAYRQQLPFQVFLNMEGRLLQPEISFNIELPDDRKGALDGTVNTRLQVLNEQENELNKQVFALLILGRFIAEDPLEAGGGGLTSTARSSASRILTQQLNQLAGRYIKGVDLTFDVESYEDFETASGEGRTELQVGLSREFLDDRLRVEVGGRVDLEGERRRRQGNISDLAGDVAVEYLLSEDGTYRLRGFRKNEFQMLLEGDIVETGLALIFTRDFNKLKELFQKRPKEEERRGQNELLINEYLITEEEEDFEDEHPEQHEEIEPME
jgi:translocation and assembly module TamB